jgi:hypothetical protein
MTGGPGVAPSRRPNLWTTGLQSLTKAPILPTQGGGTHHGRDRRGRDRYGRDRYGRRPSGRRTHMAPHGGEPIWAYVGGQLTARVVTAIRAAIAFGSGSLAVIANGKGRRAPDGSRANAAGCRRTCTAVPTRVPVAS